MLSNKRAWGVGRVFNPPYRGTFASLILADDQAITVDTGLRLDRYFGLSEGRWLQLQMECDLRWAQREIGARIVREVTLREVTGSWGVAN